MYKKYTAEEKQAFFDKNAEFNVPTTIITRIRIM